MTTFLKNSLDKGEAAVIQTAVNNHIETVCIDEVVGRRIARLHNLKLTGSFGIIIKAKKMGVEINIEKWISNMRKHRIWISQRLEQEVLRLFYDMNRQ